MSAQRIYIAPIDRMTGIIRVERVLLKGFYATQYHAENLRRTRLTGREIGRPLIFQNNSLVLPALTIEVLYKTRWQGELLFK